MAGHGPGQIQFIPFPGDLQNRYQHYTQAEIAGLRAAGYTAPFTSVEQGVRETFTEHPVPAASVSEPTPAAASRL